MTPTDAQIEAAAKALFRCQPVKLESLTGHDAMELAKAALTAAAEVKQGTRKLYTEAESAEAAAEAAAEVGYSNACWKWLEDKTRMETIERCAQYHDNAARECEAIAAVNMDNDLGASCQTRAIDHRLDAAAIRALKDKA